MIRSLPLCILSRYYGFRFDMSSYHFTVRKRLSKQTNVNIYQRVLFLRFITGDVLLSKSLCAYSFHFYGQKLIKIVNKPIHSYVMLVRVHICVYEVIVVYQLLELIKKLMLINHTAILRGDLCLSLKFNIHMIWIRSCKITPSKIAI